MAASSKIQTSLLDGRVKILNVGTIGEQLTNKGYKEAVISNVYVDPDGNPKYTLRTDDGLLHESWSSAFEVLMDYRGVVEKIK